MPAAKTDYKYIGLYAHTLANGRPVEPGESVKLDKDEVKDNQSLVDEGVLISTEKEGGK